MHGLQVRSLNLQAFAYLHRNRCFPRTTRLLGRLDIAAVDNSSLQITSKLTIVPSKPRLTNHQINRERESQNPFPTSCSSAVSPERTGELARAKAFLFPTSVSGGV